MFWTKAGAGRSGHGWVRICHSCHAILPPPLCDSAILDLMENAARRLLDRHLTPRVLEALGDARVVALLGPRQAGKTTLARSIQERDARTTFVTLDDSATRDAAQRDPRGFVEGRPGLLVIDEVQRVPELMLAIKASVDRDQRPGRFLLTGSANLFAVREISDFLAGRMEILELHPLSQGEIEGRRERFVDAVLGGDLGVGIRTELTKLDYLKRAASGGFPEVRLRAIGRRQQEWCSSGRRPLVASFVKVIAPQAPVRVLAEVATPASRRARCTVTPMSAGFRTV